MFELLVAIVDGTLGIASKKLTGSLPNEPKIAPLAFPKEPLLEPDPTVGKEDVYWF